MDKHHVAGKANSNVIVRVPVNDHRAQLSVDQARWPSETLRNPDRDPLLAIAGCNRGLRDTVRYLMDSLLLVRAEILEEISQYLRQRLGPKWWDDPALKIPKERNPHGN